MRKTLLLASAVCSIFFLSAQTYLPFVADGANWQVTDQWSLDEPPANESNYTRDNYCYTINGDTLMNNVIYKKLLANANSGQFIGTIAFIREDTINRKVYFIRNSVSGNPNPGWCGAGVEDSLLFDFSIGPRDSIYVFGGDFQSCWGSNFAVDSIKRSFMYGRNRIVWFLNASGHLGISNFSLIEGVGYSFGLFGTPVTDFYDYGFVSNLVTHCDSGCTTCNGFPASASYLSFNSEIKTFPNPSSDICTLRIDASDIMSQAILIDASGRQVMSLFSNQQLSTFNFDCHSILPGLYFVKVTDREGSVTVIKLIKQ